MRMLHFEEDTLKKQQKYEKERARYENMDRLQKIKSAQSIKKYKVIIYFTFFWFNFSFVCIFSPMRLHVTIGKQTIRCEKHWICCLRGYLVRTLL